MEGDADALPEALPLSVERGLSVITRKLVEADTEGDRLGEVEG